MVSFLNSSASFFLLFILNDARQYKVLQQFTCFYIKQIPQPCRMNIITVEWIEWSECYSGDTVFTVSCTSTLSFYRQKYTNFRKISIQSSNDIMNNYPPLSHMDIRMVLRGDRPFDQNSYLHDQPLYFMCMFSQKKSYCAL